MTHLTDVIEEVVTNYKNATFLSGGYVDIDSDYWTLSGSVGGSLTSTDLPSAQAETDALLLSNGHKRISVWMGSGTHAVVAL